MSQTKENPKVLFVGPSRMTHGGITSVLMKYEQWPMWSTYRCGWLGTQTNTTLLSKICSALCSYIKLPFILPNYDIVHFHTTPGRGMIIPLPVFLCAKALRKKIIIHLHVGNQLSKYKEDRFSKWIMNKSDLVITLADCLKRYIDRQYGLSVPVTYVYNPAPSIRTRNSQRGNYFLFSAYFTANKGYLTVLEAFAKVQKKCPDSRLIMAGTGPSSDIRKIESFIRDHSMQENVSLLGWVNPMKMEELMSGALAVCLASQSEGFPMVVLEAWSVGVPVISTLVGGLPDVAVDGENILLFPYSNSDRLAELMSQVFFIQSLRDKLREGGMKLCQGVLSEPSIEKSLINIYDSLC